MFLEESNDINNIYFHIISGSDGPVFHKHPWWSISCILSGSYIEHTADGDFKREAGDVVFREAEALHWVEINEPVYTLFITGPKIQDWGFLCGDEIIDHTEYGIMRGPDRLANGCGEI